MSCRRMRNASSWRCVCSFSSGAARRSLPKRRRNRRRRRFRRNRSRKETGTATAFHRRPRRPSAVSKRRWRSWSETSGPSCSTTNRKPDLKRECRRRKSSRCASKESLLSIHGRVFNRGSADHRSRAQCAPLLHSTRSGVRRRIRSLWRLREALNMIKKEGIETINGIYLDGTTYYRNKNVRERYFP